jgi:hypothetical protein
MTWPLKKAYKTAFDFIMPTQTVTKNIPEYVYYLQEYQGQPLTALCKACPDELRYA